jgi:putative tryptophan/tyrosine transport system permease protein
MILIGLALSNGFVALSGALIAQYQSYVDVGMGIGMVIIGLASVIIGEVVFGIKSLLRRLLAVILGAVLYRLIIAFALEIGMPATDLKLVSAVIVALAMSMPIIKKRISFVKRLSNKPYERSEKP